MSSSSDGRHLGGLDQDNPKPLKGSHPSAEPMWKCKYCYEIVGLRADSNFTFCPFCVKKQLAGEDLPLGKNPAEELSNDLKNRNSIDKVEVINAPVPKSRLSQDEAPRFFDGPMFCRGTTSDSDGTRKGVISEEILPPPKKLARDEQNSSLHILFVSEISNSTSTADSLTASDSTPLVPTGPNCEPPDVPGGSATSNFPPSSDALNAHRAGQVSSNLSLLVPIASSCETLDVPGGSAALSIPPSSDGRNIPLAGLNGNTTLSSKAQEPSGIPIDLSSECPHNQSVSSPVQESIDAQHQQKKETSVSESSSQGRESASHEGNHKGSDQMDSSLRNQEKMVFGVGGDLRRGVS